MARSGTKTQGYNGRTDMGKRHYLFQKDSGLPFEPDPEGIRMHYSHGKSDQGPGLSTTPTAPPFRRGIQYCCEEYIELLQQRGIGISMTQSGSPYDNAIAERVNGILKLEFGLYHVFKGYGQASAKVCEAIALYNNRRPHYSCDLKTPQQAHLIDLHQELDDNVKHIQYER